MTGISLKYALVSDMGVDSLTNHWTLNYNTGQAMSDNGRCMTEWTVVEIVEVMIVLRF